MARVVLQSAGEDADAPRVVQWVDAEDEDDSEGLAEEETDLDEDDENEINVIPSAKPSRELECCAKPSTPSQTRALTDSESESDAPSEDAYATEDNDERPRSTTAKGKEKEHSRTRKDLAKRSSKHAPTEITSKRPVSRRRTVIDSKTPQPRDPRFLQITGQFDPQKFRTQYTFLTALHTTELSTLRSNLKRARKLLINSPHDQRFERERESAVNRDRRERVEGEVLERVGREEREKRGRGKAGCWMKSSEKKDLLTKARYEDIASSGGKRAV
ncbi:hypothetical protein DFH29DRAFT_981530 [Suillus ampliporus]|nr:hypothetical protein DFH29DRAFT_981530 [Suillus ampliporus]